jgi:hypothetical protein
VETLLFFIVIFVALELFESNWQKAEYFYGLLKNNYQIYQKSIFLFFLFNPTFIYSIFLAIYLNNYSFLMNSIVVLKFADISLRLHFCRKIDNDEDIKEILPYNIKYNLIYRYINVVIYPLAFYFSLF